MAAAAALRGARKIERGLRPVDVRRDLGGIASLMELCFGSDLDAGGRYAVGEMRALSRTGPLLWLLAAPLHGRSAWGLGYVWVEDGQVIGNVSTQRSSGSAQGWLIANVAVHPDFRRRGIARALTLAALDLAADNGARWMALQVNADNPGAIALYRNLGFAQVAARTRWSRPAGTAPPPPADSTDATIRPRRRNEWPQQFDLAQRVRPAGLTWTSSLRPEDFRPSLARALDRFMSGQWQEHWLAVAEERVAGSLTLLTNAGDGDNLALMIHPEWRGRLERPLLARGLRRLGRRAWPTCAEHPPEPAADEAWREFGFSAGRTLVWMRRDLQ